MQGQTDARTATLLCCGGSEAQMTKKIGREWRDEAVSHGQRGADDEKLMVARIGPRAAMDTHDHTPLHRPHWVTRVNSPCNER